MGNQNNTQLSNKIDIQNKQTQKQIKQNTLISPALEDAIRCSQPNIFVKFPQLCKKIQMLKQKQQQFNGIYDYIKLCPIYYLKNKKIYYQGQWQNCLPHGIGVAVYQDMSYYEGDFNKGQLQSQQAIYFFNNGEDVTTYRQSISQQKDKEKIITINSTYFVGKFKQSKFHGQGKIHHNGIIFQGMFEEGKRQGHGKQYSNQLNYNFQGMYVNNVKYGQGYYKRVFNQIFYQYTGNFYNGIFHGHGAIKVNGNKYIQGQFSRGLPQGQLKIYYQNGVFTGKLIKGQINGQGVFVFDDKQKEQKKGYFKQIYNQKKNKRTLYFQDQQLTSRNYYEFPQLSQK